MKSTSQVCALEQAKKLKELGIEPESDTVFIWCRYGLNQDFQLSFRATFGMPSEYYYAYTVAELGVMLSHKNINTNDYPRCDNKDKGKWYLANKFKIFKDFATEAEARAAMLIHLLETGKVTAADCNQRLLAA